MHLEKLTNLNTNYLENFKNLKKIEKISLKKELIHNLVKKNKKIPSKFHYDLDGSKYFEKITKLKEYYISRTEKKILKKISNSFKKIFKDNITFVEFGSGAAEKISILIKDQVKFYVPLDISYDFLLKSSIKLAKSFLKLKIIPVYCDYINYFNLPTILSKNKIGFFLGSSIGNFYNNEEKKIYKTLKKFWVKIVFYL